MGAWGAARAARPAFVAVVAAVALVTSLAVARPPAGAAARPAPSVVMVGESVMAAMVPSLYGSAARVIGGAGWSVELDAVVCRRLVAPSCGTPPPATALDVLEAHRGSVPPAVVIGAGYNDQSTTAIRIAVAAVLAEIPGTEVFWVTYRDAAASGATYAAMDDVLRQQAATHPHLHLVDWAAASRDQPSWVGGSDGLHLTRAGSDAMASLVLGSLEAWYAQVPDDVSSPAAPSPPAPPAPPPCEPGPDTNPPANPSDASASGYWLLDSAGDVHPYGAAQDLGGLAGTGLVPAAMAVTPSGDGYWIVDEQGGVHAFGDAAGLGDLQGVPLNGPVLRIEGDPVAPGYWLVASDGGVFSFGGAAFHGSTGDTPLNAPVISMHATADGGGYWLVASDGGVFSFGDAGFHGSTGDLALAASVVSMTVDPRGTGYWLYAADGGVFAFDVPFYGSVPGTGRCDVAPTVAVRATATGRGYWVATTAGEVLAFGDARDLGDQPPLADGAVVVDMAVRP
jgi:hypothetical protein